MKKANDKCHITQYFTIDDIKLQPSIQTSYLHRRPMRTGTIHQALRNPRFTIVFAVSVLYANNIYTCYPCMSVCTMNHRTRFFCRFEIDLSTLSRIFMALLIIAFSPQATRCTKQCLLNTFSLPISFTLILSNCYYSSAVRPHHICLPYIL